jgi:hypothetical protein
MTEKTKPEARVGSNALLGRWKLKHDLRLRMGITAFGLPAGAIVTVTQLEPDMGNVMVCVDESTADWMSKYWLLEHFDFVTPNAGLSRERSEAK